MAGKSALASHVPSLDSSQRELSDGLEVGDLEGYLRDWKLNAGRNRKVGAACGIVRL
jgi:hypothetical protein